MSDILNEKQLDAVSRMHDGCILHGGVGSGKSRTAIGYFHTQYGGSIVPFRPMVSPPDLYIITTARKRDSLEWLSELALFYMSPEIHANYYQNLIFIDSWNNIKKYKNVSNAFFIFDEQRVVGTGAWVKAFLKIANKNRWILLSATPGDTWQDYIPVFLANGFYKTKREFIETHVEYDPHCRDYPKVRAYHGIKRLERLRDRLLVEMPVERHTVRHDIDIRCDYDRAAYKYVMKNRWNLSKNEPITSAADLCYELRKIVNSDLSRVQALLDIFKSKHRLIIFYNYDYELDILRNIQLPDIGEEVEFAEWNGHVHQPVPESNAWIYLVQYNAGCEAWNCIKTDTIIFYSQNYSYKVMAQASGRIDRLNTPYIDLYYYHFRSMANIDLAISRALSEKKKFNESNFAFFVQQKKVVPANAA